MSKKCDAKFGRDFLCDLEPGHVGPHCSGSIFRYPHVPADYPHQKAKLNNFPNGLMTVRPYECTEKDCVLKSGHAGRHQTAYGSTFEASSMTVRHCDATCANAQDMGACVLSPGHTGYHKSRSGFVWISYDPTVETGRTSSADAPVSNPPRTLKTCACCPDPIKHNNTHAVFCSSMCAEKAAAAAFNSRKNDIRQHAKSPNFGERFYGEHSGRPFRTAEEMNKEVGQIYAISSAADKALRFLAGLNLQDHSVKEQRESLAIVKELMDALKPEHKNEGRKK